MIWFMQYMIKSNGLLGGVLYDILSIKVCARIKNKSFLLISDEDNVTLYVCSRKDNSIILELGGFDKESIEGKELINIFNSAPKNDNYFHIKHDYNYHLGYNEYKDDKIFEKYFLRNHLNLFPNSCINASIIEPLSIPRNPTEVYKNPYYQYNNHGKKSINKFL